MENEHGKVLSSVKNALKILRAFKMNEPQKGVRELAAELGMGKSSVQRILATLASEGFVTKDEETNKYELGVSVLELNSIVLGHLELHNEAIPTIKNLVEKCRETSHLAVFKDSEIIYLCKIESRDSTELESHSGLHNYPHCTSSGKLLLAHDDPSHVETLLKNELIKFTSKTIIDPTLFQNELASIRKNGYSVSVGEYRDDITSVSAPIRDYMGKVIAAINLVGPSNRISKQRISYFATELIQAGESISEKLGYRKR